MFLKAMRALKSKPMSRRLLQSVHMEPILHCAPGPLFCKDSGTASKHTHQYHAGLATPRACCTCACQQPSTYDKQGAINAVPCPADRVTQLEQGCKAL